MIGLIGGAVAKKLLAKMTNAGFKALDPTRDLLRIGNLANRAKGKTNIKSLNRALKSNIKDFARQQGVSIDEAFKIIKSVNVNSTLVRYYGDTTNYKEFYSRLVGRRITRLDQTFEEPINRTRDYSKAIGASIERIKEFYYQFYTPLYIVTAGVRGDNFPQEDTTYIRDIFDTEIIDETEWVTTLQTFSQISAIEDTLETRLAPESESGDRVYYDIIEEQHKMLKSRELNTYLYSITDMLNSILRGQINAI